jgi:hypothetical protein
LGVAAVAVSILGVAAGTVLDVAAVAVSVVLGALCWQLAKQNATNRTKTYIFIVVMNFNVNKIDFLATVPTIQKIHKSLLKFVDFLNF